MKKTQLILMISAVFLSLFIISGNDVIGAGISISQAIEIAEKQVEGEVVKVELVKDLYEIKIKTANGIVKDIFVNAVTGEIAQKKMITLEEAIKIATDEVPGRVIKVEFEKGKYEIKIRTEDGRKVEVNVDPRSGRIVEIE